MSPALWTQCPLIVTSAMPLMALPVGPDSPCAPSHCSPTLPLGSHPLLRSSSPCGSSPCSRVSPPHFPCTPPPRALKVFSASHSCLQVLTFSRGLLHQSPQSKINEGRPKSQVHALVKEKKQYKRRKSIKKNPAHQRLCISVSPLLFLTLLVAQPFPWVFKLSSSSLVPIPL